MVQMHGLPPEVGALTPGIQQQVMAMLAAEVGAGLRVTPLPEPALQSAMPPGATRFALDFQYCLERVRWTVIMQRWGAQWAPDFMFSESTFTPLVPGPGCGANATQLAEALAKPGEPQQLAHIVSLLLASYAAHHAKRVDVIAATDDQLQFELDTTDAEGRQVMLQNTAGASTMKVVCVLPVPGISLAPLLGHPQPQQQQQQQPMQPGHSADAQKQGSRPGSPSKSAAQGKTAAAAPQSSPAATDDPPEVAAHAAALAAQIRLKVVYSVGSAAAAAASYAAMAGGGGGRTPQLSLHLPPELSALLGRTPSLPSWTSGMCLMEFLPAAADAVQTAVEAAAAARSGRHALLQSVSSLAGAPLFCDTVHWWKGTWRVEIQGLVCLLYVVASPEFPDRMPELTLQVDGAGFDESRPFVRYSDYGWSPRWPPAEAAQRIFTHLEDTAPQWKAHLQPPQPLPISGLPPQQQQHQHFQQSQHQFQQPVAASPTKHSPPPRPPLPEDLLS